MPSIAYMNQSAPFWDWVASLEQQGFSQNQNEANNENTERGPGSGEEGPFGPPPFGLWGWGHPGFGGRGFPHRGPPPPPGPPPAPNAGHEDAEQGNEKEGEKDNEEGPSGSPKFDNEEFSRGWGRGGRCGGRRGRHGFGGPHGHHGRGGFGPHHGGPRGWGGPWGGRGGSFNPWNFAEGVFDTFKPKTNDSEDFVPDADIFSTPSEFVIHISLPGAKKEDVGVNWDAEKSELSIAGVIYRPGDEEFLKTLEMGERRVGPFERKVRLGTRANPAQVDEEGITAKLEDGVLRVEVPKRFEGGFVEVRKVDIE
ncbi:HSP20-like chaperone [Lindgomyces ingoldianus]|uniref:HSP20-like chaperone n=1 Tax=Lindgomyces ingoldianus TaxID=673940 RepID=A0ACB6QJ12_9PLEO|nr:HSP20-like chaperone [Lindgomyces ingoldianus]KAF2466317.1 HSP20-like chaperone [Lindgomyces ingoldianus]